MLILSRDTGQSIIINNNVKITILSKNSDKVRVGIEAPKEISVDREEVHQRKLQQAICHTKTQVNNGCNEKNKAFL